MGRNQVLSTIEKARIYKKYTQNKGVTQRELVDDYDVSQATISRAIQEMDEKFENQVELISFIKEKRENPEYV